MDWETLRDGLLRSILGDAKDEVDPSIQTNFSDAQLLLWWNAAQTVVSQTAGPISSFDLVGDSVKTAFALPDDYVGSPLIQDTKERFLKVMDISAGSQLSQSRAYTSEAAAYVIHWPSSGYIYLSRAIPVGETWIMRYRARWPDISVVTPVPPEVEAEISFYPWNWISLAVSFYVGYLAYTAEAGRRALLEQFATRPELLVDNPLEQQAQWYWQQYQRLLHGNNDA